jgi:pimeloyl-ACP methyl ester carboxylesterase
MTMRAEPAGGPCEPDGITYGADDLLSRALGSPRFATTDRGNRVRFFDAHPDAPVTLVLVHGGGANAAWWLRVAPTLAKRFRVLTVELSGHGDSDHCADYSPENWAQDVASVLEHAEVGDFHLVGHSMGGRVATYVAASHSRTLSLTLIDTPFHRPGSGRVHGRARDLAKKLYRTADEAVTAFRLRPKATIADPDLIKLVAYCSIIQTPSGWTWKFDPAATQRFTDEGLERELRKVRCPMFYIRAEQSSVTEVDTAGYLKSVVDRLEAHEIAGAYHHVPLDFAEVCCVLLEERVDQIEQTPR